MIEDDRWTPARGDARPRHIRRHDLDAVEIELPAFEDVAVAFGLRKDDGYYQSLSGDLELKRDRFAAGLERIGFGVARCEGTYFITGDVMPLGINEPDGELCQRITREAGVASVPVSAFYQSAAPKSFLRFCFAKRDEVLDAALDRLGEWTKSRRRAS